MSELLNLSSLYGNKGTTGNNSLTSTEWNNLMRSLDDNFSIKNENSDITPDVSLNDSALLSILKMNSATPDFSIDIDDTIETEPSSSNALNAGNITTHGTYPNTAVSPTSLRGGAALYNLVKLSGYSLNTTTATQLANVATTGGVLTEVAKGDRVRFGSWYLATSTQVNFNCSHEFVELVNSGTDDFPLDDVVLGVIYRNDYSSDSASSAYYSIEKYSLSGSIKKLSTYLIRGKQFVDASLDSTYIKINNNYDIDLATVEGYGTTKKTLSDAVGLLLFNSALSDYVATPTNGTGGELSQLVASGDSTWLFLIDNRLIDVIILDSTAKNNLKNGKDGNKLYGNHPVYAKVANAIVKDQYSLDPAKQAFRSLTKCATEASNVRLDKVLAETIPLNNYNVSFPHSKPTTPVTKFTPKASGQSKNVMTDKTSPNFTKPNMVFCSHGINARTTRCFSWFSMSLKNEYVWIKKIGDKKWHRFESYKEGDGTNDAIVDNNTKMHRVEFAKPIINSIYKRIDNVFPGDSTYQYRSHKCIVYIQPEYDFSNPITYQYIVGEGLEFNGTIIPKEDATSDIQTFTIYPKTWTPKVYHVTDQQGFGWMEYQVWSAAAEEINNKIAKECTPETKLFPILINTGDSTQNGTRINEWLDYYEGGKSLFSHIEAMDIVGNNDLCNSIDEKALGNGDDTGKSSPYYFHVTHCYEVDNNIELVISGNNIIWTGNMICNNVYVPSMYYFHFDKYCYLMVNSELTETTFKNYFKLGSDVVNLYTGYSLVECGEAIDETSITTNKANFLGDTLLSWINKFKTSFGANSNTIIAACHEMPYTVIILMMLKDNQVSMDRSLNNKLALIGSHLNILGKGEWLKDNTYWFSRMLLDNGVKLCIGGHKHTYGITYPTVESDPAVPTDLNVHFSKTSIIDRTSPSVAGTVTNKLWRYSSQGATGTNGVDASQIISIPEGKTPVTYFMLLATGYKQKSNKELPSVEQYYSHVVPETSGWKDDGTGTPDNSQLYPMYGTYEYKSNGIAGSIYRVINIVPETYADATHVCTPKTFSLTAYSTDPMYSEMLMLKTDLYGTSTNLWYIPEDFTTYSPGCDETGMLRATQRCIKIDDTYKYLNKSNSFELTTFIPENKNCTVLI